jgi:hypothetical protein
LGRHGDRWMVFYSAPIRAASKAIASTFFVVCPAAFERVDQRQVAHDDGTRDEDGERCQSHHSAEPSTCLFNSIRRLGELG